MESVHIRAEHITVEFPIFNASHRSLKKAVLRATTGGRVAHDAGKHVVVRAVSDATFEFKPGDRVALVGHNGAGKTTLLRVLSGVYAPVSGRLDVQGRIGSLLDISLGMDPEATGYENIFLRGVVMGLRPSEIEAKIDEIAEFSELGDYLNMPTRTYSSGMALRLAFAVSTAVHPDILLMDEWLSVGDESFNKKASERLNSLVERSSILVMASHSPQLIERVCNRKIVIEKGTLTEVPMDKPTSDLIASA
ncbi:sugar ABC transporter ATP-binding protein [Burkholderia stagnalis]|uniref:ABC transporter ATP-binding protein n=1 Tax=Burkholderia stagnalis TaxID=1503054 RepID=UPI00075FA0BC|nr:ABC transporter ATP-binding protein [Burkholderia stagnalis]KWK52844.1 sugar ABC transporter ATP-binding protein [Burkholderia stagnalis]KWK60566.1 sugar ABC transporter ATP-binding protein [Burkholderia stagnalis]KWN72427.1 sugar ABC transporter ATP-binding protein [Burkholderia stagnalis]